MSDTAAEFKLEDQGRLVDPAAYAAFLREVDGRPVVIDACNTPIITSLHLQVHIAAEAHWAAQGISFEIVNQSDQFGTCLSLLGWQQTH